MYTWAQFQALVLSILTDSNPSDEVFTIACAEYVKAKCAREFDRSIERHDSYWKDYIVQRDRLVGYRYSNNGTSAQASITFLSQPNNGDTVSVNGKTYTFQTVLTNVDGNVAIGSSVPLSVVNILAAIGLLGGAGTAYAASMSGNYAVTPFGSGSTLTVQAVNPGAAGNAITVAATGAASWSSVTLTGGTDSPLISAVNTLITIDANRQGAAAFVAAMLQQAQLDIQNRSNQILEFIRLGIIDLQTSVPLYRVGQSTIYTVTDLTLVGAASQGTMPEGAQITDGYYKQLTSSVTGVDMVNEGSGYTVANVSFIGDGQNASGTAVISHSKIIGVQMTMFGYGYTVCTVAITGDGTGAEAIALLNP